VDKGERGCGDAAAAGVVAAEARRQALRRGCKDAPDREPDGVAEVRRREGA